MEEPFVVTQNKFQRGFLLLFFAVICSFAAARGITGEGAATKIFSVLFGIAGIACAVGWFIMRGRPPGHIEVTSTSIVKWTHGGKYQRVTAGPIRVFQSFHNGHPGTWNLEPFGRPLEIGQTGVEEVRSADMSLDLLGYHPFEMQQICADRGWTLVDADGHPLAP